MKRKRRISPMAKRAAQIADAITARARERPKNDKVQDKNNGIREMDGEIRSASKDGDGRVFTLSFSSEEPYTRYWGVEILDHTESCVDLTRLNSIGCVLFNHDRDKVIGKIRKAWLENGRGMAEIEFDSDADAEVVYQKVKSGTLKGVSVGYMVESWEEVAAGGKSADGRFSGPCSIAKRWTPYEISIVSVPADPTVGVGRSAGSDQNRRSMKDIDLQIQINENVLRMMEMEARKNDD